MRENRHDDRILDTTGKHTQISLQRDESRALFELNIKLSYLA